MLQRIIRTCRLLGLLALIAFASTLIAGWGRAAESPREGPLRVLVITGGHAYEEEPFQALFRSIPDIVTQYETYPRAAELLKPELAKTCDVIVFYDMWARGITPAQQQDFVALLNQGIGVVALHHTLGAHANWPEYGKIIGGRYHVKEEVIDGKTFPPSGYEHGQDIEVQVVDSQHPITRGMKDFKIHDETYCRYDTDPQAHVLLKTNHPKSDPELAWVKTYGRSRVFCLQLGHDHFAYEHPSYRELIARGIRWAAGQTAEPAARP